MTITIEDGNAELNLDDGSSISNWSMSFIPKLISIYFQHPQRVHITGVRYFDGIRNVGLVYGGER